MNSTSADSWKVLTVKPTCPQKLAQEQCNEDDFLKNIFYIRNQHNFGRHNFLHNTLEEPANMSV